jgi:hypothetical protein
MTFHADPYSLREIGVIPVVINESCFFLTQFTLFIFRVISLALHPADVFTVLSNSIFTHVITLASPVMNRVFVPPFFVGNSLTRLTKSIELSWGCRIFMELSSCQDFLASGALFCFSYNFYSTFPRAFLRTSFSFMGMSRRHKELLSTNNTGQFNLIVIPRLLFFFKLECFKMFGAYSHSWLNDTIRIT